jgi:hypothetical protein
MSCGNTEDRHDTVTDELLDATAVTLDFAADSLVIWHQTSVNVFRVGFV